LGPEGYHWRVLVEDKVGADASAGERPYSWWDIQDGNAKLPVKQCTQNELRKLLHSPKARVNSTDHAANVGKAAKGAFKMMGKMAESVVGSDTGESPGPPVAVMTFKLVDLVKIQDDMEKRGSAPPPRQPRARAAAASQPQAAPRAAPRPAAPRPAAQPSAQPRQQARPQARPQAAAPQQRAPPKQQEASLLDFGSAHAPPAGRHNPKALNHTTSAPAALDETRAQRLKREQEKRNNSANRVWDDIDQRWVEAMPQAAASGAPAAKSNVKVVGVKLDGSSAVGKSAEVQAGVNKRVNDMAEAQQKALQEVREREAKKKRDDEEEDEVRKRLEPKIKKWGEEHGKKKQIRALLATLHTILWPGTKWKQIGIGDLLDDSKVKRSFHKATLVVHPDKTHELPSEQRFLAKRIFDALCQAKTEFDTGNM
jgi:hypothetical protein